MTVVSCSSTDVACPPGFVATFVAFLLVFAVLWFFVGQWLLRRIAKDLRAGKVREGFHAFWPWLGPIPLGYLRFLMRARWVIAAFMTLVPAIIGTSAVASNERPAELRLAIVAFCLVFVAAAWYWVWVLGEGVRRGGGLPPRKRRLERNERRTS